MSQRELRDAVCKTLLDNIGRGELWHSGAPSAEARQLMTDDLAPISAEDRIVLGTVLSLSDGGAGPTFREILRGSPLQTELIGTLLVAAAKGSDALELWIRQNQTTHEQGALDRPSHARELGASLIS